MRSQNKEDLVKINQISLFYGDKKRIIANYQPDFVGTQGEYYELLGIYKTKERALEVLDEIQNILKPKCILDSSSIKPDGDSWVENGIILQKYNANARVEELSTYVYEMPQE